MRSVETRWCGATTRWQVSCEARACRRWRHLIAVCAGTDPIEASTDIGINSLDAQKCGGRGMAANSQLKRHGCGVSGSTSRVSSGERKSHGSWHVRHKGVGSGGTEVWPLQARTIVNHVDAQNYSGRGMDPNTQLWRHGCVFSATTTVTASVM